eukprot:c25174_g1_i1 orf=3-191(-)
MASLRCFVTLPDTSSYRSCSFTLPSAPSTRCRPLRIRSADSGAEPSVKPAITLSSKALSHLSK